MSACRVAGAPVDLAPVRGGSLRPSGDLAFALLVADGGFGGVADGRFGGVTAAPVAAELLRALR